MKTIERHQNGRQASRSPGNGPTASRHSSPPVVKRAAVYVRMSTDAQEDSPERQLSQVLPYCERQGYRIAGRYQDLGMKGYDDSRPEFQRLLRDAQAGFFDVIVVDEQSRLSRNNPLDYFGAVVYPLTKAGVALETVARGIVDWDDLPGFILQTVDQHAASKESVTLSRRVMTELVRKASRGELAQGKPPYGYRREWDATPRLVPGDEKEVEVVRFLFNSYVNRDQSLGNIRDELRRRGVLTPRGGSFWSKTMIRKILQNRAYVGDYIYGRTCQSRFHRTRLTNGNPVVEPVKAPTQKCPLVQNDPGDWVVIANAHPPLIDRDLFQKAQALLKCNRERRGPTGNRGDFILAKLLVCTQCGSYMSGRKDRRHRIYRCSGFLRYGRAFCAPNQIREDDALDRILAVLQEHFLNPERLDELRAEARALQESRETDQTIRAHRREIVTLDSKIARATTNVILLDPALIPEAQKQIREWQIRRATVVAEIEQLEKQAPVEDTERVIRHMETCLWRLRSSIEQDDWQMLRETLRECLMRLELRFVPEPRAKRTFHRLTGGIAYLYSGEAVALESISHLLTSLRRSLQVRGIFPCEFAVSP